MLRSYDGARPALPGLASWFREWVHPHQLAAVARIVNEPAVLLAHDVGAGKTAEMAMGAMELRRLGLAVKPAIVVPNHMLEQFQREFLQLYPQARVLAAGSDDLKALGRHRFVARIATGNWDAVIMSQSVFERIPMSAPEIERYVNAQLAGYDAWLERAREARQSKRVIKKMETRMLMREQRLRKKLDRARDGGICWEQTGIDYLFIDEAHDHKNLDTRSNNSELDIDGSGRASDLEMKLDYLRAAHGRRVVTFATATPIANSMTEAYVMCRYLRPDLLADAGIEDFDAWVGTFAETTTDVEVAPEGGIRVKDRFARFRNIPELLDMWRIAADVKTREDLNLPVPELAGGKPEVIPVEPSRQLLDFMVTLASRAEDVRRHAVLPEEDNMLKISNDGRLAALDPRLAGLGAPETGKLDVAAQNIARIWQEHRDDTYHDGDGNLLPVTGSLQIVFCDLGTPGGSSRWNAYDYLRGKLAEYGLDPRQVRFMHDAKTDKAKAELFAAARAGKVAVLIGSTKLMGVGTNVQDIAVALHHLDCPWRPADVAQREGRILRQRNKHPKVHVYRYVTERSFDAYMWQTVTRKAKFIDQVIHGKTTGRDAEDIGGDVQSLSYSEVTALATGDMRILAKAKADSEVQRLERLESAWRRTQQHLKTKISDSERSVARLTEVIAQLESAIERRVDTRGDAFTMRLDGQAFSKRTDAAACLRSTLRTQISQARKGNRPRDARGDIGTLGGFTIICTPAWGTGGQVWAHLRFDGVAVPAVRISETELDLAPDKPPVGLITRLENKLADLGTDRDKVLQEVSRIQAEAGRARTAASAPFAHAAELSRARAQSDRLAEELSGEPSAPPPAPTAAEAPDASPPAPQAAADASEPGTQTVPPQEQGPAQGAQASPQPAPTGLAHPVAPARQPAAGGPADDTTGGPVIEHHQQGTLVRGTQKDDQQLRRLLHDHGFRWSGSLNAWYLPRPWTFSTRSRRVSSLTADLRQAHRSFTLQSEPPAPSSADDSPPHEPLPAADPYADLQQARDDHFEAIHDYWALTRTPAGNNVMAAYPQSGARPDALALDAAYKAAGVSWQEAFAGDPQEVAGRFAAWAQAANALSRNLAAERHRAPAFRQALDTFLGTATRLASRTQATAQDPAAWARVFAALPGSAPASSPEPEQAATPDPARPAAGSSASSGTASGEATAISAAHLSAGQDDDIPSSAPPATPAAATAAASSRPPQDEPPGRAPAAASPGANAARPGQPPASPSPRAGGRAPAGSSASGSEQPSRPGPADARGPDKAKAVEVVAAARQASTPPARSATGKGAGVTGAHPDTAAPSQPASEPPPVPVTNSDLVRALHHLHGGEFAQVIGQAQEPGRAGSRSWRHDGGPGAGTRESLHWDASGLRLTISGSGIRRYSLLTWPQIEHWIDAGMTPARLGLIVTASQLRSFCQSHRQELIAAGRCDPDAAASELAQIRDDAISTVIAAALRTRGAAAPVPPARPGTPAYRTATMITRPDPDAGKGENTALERLARLRAAVADPQPVTAAEIKAAIRKWIGDSLPDHVRALDSPAKMRAWIEDQVTTRAGRPAPVTYDNPGTPGGRWYSASPEGLLTGTGGDYRAETLIRWEEIPAWTQPGITTSLRDRLLSADDTRRKGFRRRLTAAAHPHSGVAAPSDQQDEQSARQLREVIAAAWAAIDAAPAPGPAQLDQARRTYRATSPVQETLFAGTEPARQRDDASRTAGQPPPGARPSAQAPPGPAAPPADSNDTSAIAEARAVSASAAPARKQRPGALAPAVAARAPQHPPAQAPRPQPGTPLSDDDICLGLRRLPPLVFADLIGTTEAGRPMDPATRQLAPYSGERAAGEPGSGARETVTASPAGVRIQADAADGTRAGLLSWPEVARWVQPGLTPARRQIIGRATRTGLRFAMAHASFRGIGEAALAAAAEQELRGLAAGAVTAMLEDARAARTGQPRRGSQPGRGDGEAAALERIADLAAALPARPPQPRTTVWQVKAGDIIGHPGYRLQPFLVSAPPRDRAGQIEITGRLTDPADGEPAGQITFILTRTGHPDPVVSLVPPPVRSLRSLSGSTTTAEGHPGRDHPRAGEVNGTGQPPVTAQLKQEDTMPPALPATTSPLPEETAPAGRPAPPAGPAPATWKLVARPGPASQARPGSQPADDTRLLHELDHVLAAITERRRAASALPGTDGTSFADIRAAFTVLRQALDLPGPASNGHGARPAAAVPDAAQPASPPPGASQDGGAAPPGDFADIRAAFAGLRDVLGLPAPGDHARSAAPRPDGPAGPEAPAGPDAPARPDTGRLLDQAAAEAHACARWYRDTPEWQRMSRIGRAARKLLTAIREAAGDYWAEIRLDIRVRGFARTLAARVSLAVSGAAHLLAGRLERAGHRDTRPWRAAWRLHHATATFASRVMNYTPPGSPARMDDARRIIGDLGHGTRRPGGPEPSPAAGPPGGDTRTPGAVALGRECFPVLVSRANAQPGAATAARIPAQPRPRQAPAAARR